MSPQTTDQTPDQGIHNAQDNGFTTAPSSGSDSSLAEALAIFRKRKWILLLCSLLGLVIGFYRVAREPQLFEAYARVQVRTGASTEYKVSTGATNLGIDPVSRIMTEISILQSDSLLLSVAREMNLANNPTFYGAKGPVPQVSLDDPNVRQNIVHALQGGLHVSLVPKTEIMLISYTHPNAKMAADIVNQIIAAYVQRSYQVRYDSSQRVSHFLSGQLNDLRRQVEQSQEDVLNLQKKLGVLGLDSKNNQINTSLDDLSRAAGAARIARIIAESRFRTLNSTDLSTLDGTIETTPGTAPAEFFALRSQIAIGKSNEAQLLTIYGPNHPLVKAQTNQLAELERQLESEQKRLVAQARENYLAARANEEQTNNVLNSNKSDAYKLRDDLVQFTAKSRELDANRTLYEGLSNRLRTAGIEAGLDAVEIDVVDQAQIPASAIPHPYSTVIIATTIFGFIVGIAIAFLLESLDTGLRGIAEIEHAIELPSLAIVPKERRLPSSHMANLTEPQRHIGVLAQPRSHFAESIRSLRTSLLLSTAGHSPRTILVTSASPSEGKTTAACNLACVLAQRENKVLLIDADLRRPGIDRFFGLQGKLGLSTLLAGVSTLPATVQRVRDVSNLDILIAGPIPPFPTEMLGSAAMVSLLAQCAQTYTHVILDSPPVLSVTDGVILARHSEAVVLVIRHGKSGKNVVRRARDLLVRSGAPVTGLVVNAVDMSSPEYRGYSGYSYSTVDSDNWESQMRAHQKNQPEGRDGQ